MRSRTISNISSVEKIGLIFFNYFYLLKAPQHLAIIFQYFYYFQSMSHSSIATILFYTLVVGINEKLALCLVSILKPAVYAINVHK